VITSLVSEKIIDLNGENLQDGLRILAKIIVREHTRIELERSKSDENFDKYIPNK
jgi:hypothetical protein